MDRAEIERILREQAEMAGATGDMAFLGSFTPRERTPSAPVNYMGDRGRTSGWRDPAAAARVLNEPGALDSLGDYAQNWLYPTEGPSRALGAVFGARNPFSAAANQNAPLVSQVLTKKGVPAPVAMLAEWLVPDPMGARTAGDLIPLLGLLTPSTFHSLLRSAENALDNLGLWRQAGGNLDEMKRGLQALNAEMDGALSDLLAEYGPRSSMPPEAAYQYDRIARAQNTVRDTWTIPPAELPDDLFTPPFRGPDDNVFDPKLRFEGKGKRELVDILRGDAEFNINSFFGNRANSPVANWVFDINEVPIEDFQMIAADPFAAQALRKQAGTYGLAEDQISGTLTRYWHEPGGVPGNMGRRMEQEFTNPNVVAAADMLYDNPYLAPLRELEERVWTLKQNKPEWLEVPEGFWEWGIHERFYDESLTAIIEDITSHPDGLANGIERAMNEIWSPDVFDLTPREKDAAAEFLERLSVQINPGYWEPR